MRNRFSGHFYQRLFMSVVALGIVALSPTSQAASFGINFGSGNQGWGPYYVNSANGTSAHGAEPYTSAFGVVAADWYEPGPVANTPQLPGAPTSVPFSPASMGSGGVNIAFASAHPPSGVENGYTWSAYGFANANDYGPWQEDGAGNRLTQFVPAPEVQPGETPFHNGYHEWILAPGGGATPENGKPESGEHAVLAGFLFGINAAEGWDTHDIVVTLTGMNSIASEYKVTLLASAQNGGGNPGFAVRGFTPATLSDNAANSDFVDFELLPDRPDYWSQANVNPEDNPYVSVAGQATSQATFTGDELTIRISGWNEYLNVDDDFNLWRTTLAGVVIEYESIVTPEGLPGDFNNDGIVDAADYTLWRNNLDGDEAVLNGNGNGSGLVDVGDYELWKTHYGNTAPGELALAATQVPEPANIAVGLFSLLACGLLYAVRRYRDGWCYLSPMSN